MFCVQRSDLKQQHRATEHEPEEARLVLGSRASSSRAQPEASLYASESGLWSLCTRALASIKSSKVKSGPCGPQVTSSGACVAAGRNWADRQVNRSVGNLAQRLPRASADRRRSRSCLQGLAKPHVKQSA